MRGRKPIPTKLKEVHGNPGKRPINRREPQLIGEQPSVPAHLSTVAKKEWQRISADMYCAGILTSVDRGALAAYCQAYANWVKAQGELAKGKLVIVTIKGNRVQNPYLGIANHAMDLMVKYAAEFGMTPSSRSRIRVAPIDEEDALEVDLFGASVAVGK